MTVNFEQILDDSLNTLNMKPGSLVTGIVMDILDTYVVVHVGLKSEASVPINEFYDESGELAVEVGDEVQLTLEAVEDGHGNTRVSREKAIKKEKRFAYPSFGTFTVRTRKARKGRNPQTGEEIKIKASKTVGFKPAPTLKNSL